MNLSLAQPLDLYNDLLEILATAAGVPFDAAVVKKTLAQDKSLDSSIQMPDPLIRVAAAARNLGMDARPQTAPLRQVVELVREGAPVLVTSAKLPAGVILLRTTYRQVQIVDSPAEPSPRWVSPRELAEVLGIDSENEKVDALLVQAQLPMQAMHREELHHGRSPLRRLTAFLKIERRDVFVVVVYAIGIGILTLATPLAVESLVNSIAFGGLIQPLLIVSLLLFASLAFAAVLRVMQTIVVEFLQRRIFVRLIADLAYRLPRVLIAVYDRHHGPELVNRFFDVVTVQKVCATLLLEGVGLVLSTLIGAILLAVYHPYLLVYDVVLVTAMTGVIFLLGKGAVQTSINESLAKYAVADCLEEFARAPLAFKLGAGPELAVAQADRTARIYLSARDAHFRIVLRQVIFALGLQALASTVLLGLGGWLVIAGQLTLGQLVAAELIVTVVIGSFTKIGKHLESFYDLLAAMEKLGHLIDLPLESEGSEAPARKTEGVEVVLRNVHFAHGESSPPLFESLSLELHSGERVAVVGGSGSGKSTLLELLQGLRLPDSGSVRIDGVDSRILRASEIRRSIALVRDLDIVSGTILENVRMGRHEITASEIAEALARVELLEEISRLPEGLNTQLFPAGSPLSRGQASRLLLARAIVGKPRFLLIDGALDGFDSRLRQRLAAVLLDQNARWTVVIVSQCPDIVAGCDRVINVETSCVDELNQNHEANVRS